MQRKDDPTFGRAEALREALAGHGIFGTIFSAARISRPCRGKVADRPADWRGTHPRLVELGLTVKTRRPTSDGQKLRARETAKTAIDRMTDTTANPDDQASRKRRLLKGPEEFREARVDRPKKK